MLDGAADHPGVDHRDGVEFSQHLGVVADIAQPVPVAWVELQLSLDLGWAQGFAGGVEKAQNLASQAMVERPEKVLVGVGLLAVCGPWVCRLGRFLLALWFLHRARSPPIVSSQWGY